MKILSLSHADLDGIGCQLSIHEKFKGSEIKFLNFSYENIQSKIRSVQNFNYYYLVFITDLNFSEKDQEILYEKLVQDSFTNKIVYLDHHEYSDMTYLDKCKEEFGMKVLVDQTKSATKNYIRHFET
jgi:oligoribonuclease NrnB/cAMP/cGMP phosphodiesterase (DHH superfamily)